MRTWIATVLVLVLFNPTAFARTWTDSTGKYTIEAQFVDFKDGTVQLEKEDGTIVSIPVDKLSDRDQRFVRSLRDKSSRSEKPVSTPRPEVPIEKPVSTPRPEAQIKKPVSTPRPEGPISFSEAVSRHLVGYSASGGGLQSLNLSLKSRSDKTLNITIFPGTFFTADSPGIQSMVVTSLTSVVLPRRGSGESVSIGAACAEMYKRTPGKSDKFRVGPAVASEDLNKLLDLPEFYRANSRVQQFAIWTVTDNPSRNGYVRIRIGTVDVGSGPSASEIERIRAFFGEAGISTQKYRVFETAR